jgi:Caspase domain
MKHHLLIIGVAKYQPGWGKIQDGVEVEVEKARSLFLNLLTFEQSTFVRVTDTTQIGIKNQIADWCEMIRVIPGATSDDLLVVYYTGHGIVENSIFYLVTSEIREDRPATAMQLANLIPLIWSGDRQVLLILDTCQSGAGTGDALPLIDRLREAVGGAARGFGVHIIATARSIETARTRAFIDGLDQVIRSGSASVPDEEFLRPDTIMKQVNDVLASAHTREDQQHAELSYRAEGAFQFFPNPQWEPRLRIGMAPNEAQRVLECVRKRAMKSHWGPRARGVALDSEPGWFFTGRSKAARALVSWNEGASGQRGLIVTGPPGSGKSALLARMVTLADSSGRENAQRAGALEVVQPEELPIVGSFGSAVHARAKTAGEIALELAVALGANLRSGETEPEALARTAAVACKTPTTLLVDALDEAQNPEQVAAFFRSIADRAKEIRIVVGLRGEEGAPNRLIDRLGPRFATCDLGTEEYLDVEDIRRYVERCLLESTSSPYAKPGQEKYAAKVASAVVARAGRSFLVASRTARSLVAMPEVIPATELGELPSAAGEAFEFDLKLLSDSERNEAIAIFGALAFAQGRGLPRTLWAPFATALGTGPFSDRDIERWQDRSGSYVTREEDLGSPVIRLYHEEFARFLRQKVTTAASDAGGAGQDAEGIIVETLEGTVPIDSASGERNWTEASAYVRSYLTRHLKAAGRYSALYSLVFDQRWISAKTERGDFAPLLDDLDVAIQAAQEEDPANVEAIARCCLAYSRYMTTAPPLIVDVLAMAGQLNRAAFIADNIGYPLDRCQAFCFLAEHNAITHPERARRHLVEARRSARSVLGSYRAMTSYWVVHAAMALADLETAQQIARGELHRTQLKVQRSLGDRPVSAGWWEEEQTLLRKIVALDNMGMIELPEEDLDASRQWKETDHALFWTAKALHKVGDMAGLETIRRLLDATKQWGFNLTLQTAGIAGDIAYLESFLPRHQGELPSGPGGILAGNLALALATAGRCDDVKWLLAETRSQWEKAGVYMYDSAKRLAWALALCGRIEESFAYVVSILHPEERLRALYRVTEVLKSRGRTADLSIAADLTKKFLEEEEQELQRILSSSSAVPRLQGKRPRRKAAPKSEPSGSERWLQFAAGDFWRLQTWASWILAMSGQIDRSLELAEAVCAEGILSTEETSLARPTRLTELRKMHVSTAGLSNSDERKIRAQVGIAVKLKDRQRALDLWLSAVNDARRVGQGLVIEVLGHGKQLLGKSAQSRSLDELLTQAKLAANRALSVDQRGPKG